MGEKVRPRILRSQRVEFWRLWRAGMLAHDAAMMVGMSASSARLMVRESGGVAPRIAAGSHRFLSLAERIEIQSGVTAGYSVRRIARGLGRSPSTVSRELARNRVRRDGTYSALAADGYAQLHGKRPKPRKLACNDRLAAAVAAGLDKRWSPREISERLVMEFGDDPSMRISHEAIYQSLFMLGRGGLRKELVQALRSGRALRRPRTRVGERRGRIPDMVSISQRPAEVADRAVPGHWEGDLIMGKDNASAIGTLVERTTRFTMLLHLPDGHDALHVRDAVIAAAQTLPAELRRTLTWDRGREMMRHRDISLATNFEVFFADPASPWQRGTNENTNGLLRQYFPKSTDLSIHSAEQLRFVQDEFNDRPRAVLGYKKPTEVIANLLLPSDT